MFVTEIKDAQIIMMKRDGILKQHTRNVIKKYKLENLHDFKDESLETVEDIIKDLELLISETTFRTSMISKKHIPHCEKHEKEMIYKVKKFWEFRNRLIEDNNLALCPNFKNEFEQYFK